MLSVLALTAKGIGASTSLAGVVVSMAAFGTVVFDIPSGRVIAHFGEMRAAQIATFLAVVGLTGAFLSRSPVLLAVAVFVVGCGWGLWNLRLLTYLSRVMQPAIRGRALALSGGVFRAGYVIGPFVLAAFVGSAGDRSVFLIFLTCAVLGSVLLFSGRDRNDHAGHQRGLPRIHPLKILRDHRRKFLTAGVGTFGISMLRGSRQALLPLWGAHIGLHISAIALIFSLSSVLDIIFFYPAGYLSDRFGRKSVALPCILLLSLGHLLLPLTHGFGSLVAVALLLGFGNSLGSGIVMTLGADRAPSLGRASFLSVWQLIADSGTTAGPLIGAAVVAVASLSLAGPVVALLGLIAAVVVLRFMDEPDATRALAHERRSRGPSGELGGQQSDGQHR
jgi:MFS family permease